LRRKNRRIRVVALLCHFLLEIQVETEATLEKQALWKDMAILIKELRHKLQQYGREKNEWGHLLNRILYWLNIFSCF